MYIYYIVQQISALNNLLVASLWGFPGGSDGKESACQCSKYKRCGFDLWVGKIPWRRGWLPIPVFLTGKSHGQRSLAGYSPWGLKESDTTERLTHSHTFTASHLYLAPDNCKLNLVLTHFKLKYTFI